MNDNDLAKRFYRGDGERHYQPLKDAVKEREPYIADSALVEAVNVALRLRRPLLLEGEPGCGKTRLAYAVAYELGYPLKECYVRSTSRARDFLYNYDALNRLYDAQMAKALDEPVDIVHKDYVTLRSLGEAIQLSAEDDTPSVVLIDEVDKADLDFPNDLLLYLDRLQFQVDEVPSRKYDALKSGDRDQRSAELPLFIITSNREKELPKAFLRRCLFYYIGFPNQELLQNIIRDHLHEEEISPLFVEVVKKFWELREARFSWRKKPSTSELLDWIRVVEDDVHAGKLTLEQLTESPLAALPHLETLVKTQSDLDTLKRRGHAASGTIDGH